MTAKSVAHRVKEVLKGKVAEETPRGAAHWEDHQCDLVKIPRMPLSLIHLFPRLVKKMMQRKTSLISSGEVRDANAYHSHVEHGSLEGADLVPARVKRWRLVSKKIPPLSQESSHKFAITRLDEQTEEVSAQKQSDALWEEMIKTKEERQFQIGHITKYFS